MNNIFSVVRFVRFSVLMALIAAVLCFTVPAQAQMTEMIVKAVPVIDVASNVYQVASNPTLEGIAKTAAWSVTGGAAATTASALWTGATLPVATAAGVVYVTTRPAATVGGAMAGAAAGTAICPVIGTAVGVVVGGIIGFIL